MDDLIDKCIIMQIKGPGPGMYESQLSKNSPAVSSSFKSKVPRFDKRPSVSSGVSCFSGLASEMCNAMIYWYCPLQKVPGPGTYSFNDSVFGVPKPVPAAALQHMKKKHGVTIS